MSASPANHQSETSSAAGGVRIASTPLTSLNENQRPYGQAFCHFTRSRHEELDWKPEAISLVRLWMKGVQDLQVSDSGLGLLTAYVRLDAIRNTGAVQGLLPASVSDRMNERVKECFRQQGRRLASDSSPDSVLIEASVSLGDMGSLRTRGATVH
ncbi:MULTISPECIES: hypothetical protein [Achromobacter]|uniref:Uncharacterized protein n=1 Tax=Achromobacter mucicolens TaxID=1389922 RepID=A0ABM8LKS5_9BURK|nr:MULTISPECIES: hypothetical protein [Achromobacter]AVG43872.1 hypothetical protein MC81_30640 [Achromobacter insolitus]CAB3845864.1 hypothetical protein LMG3410_01512 [Achromobacter aegrifaciens]CAB3914150.1 hypothetical protein LMG3415_05137 [Achromobacter mucicolens]